ncbi:unnamed protein product [Peronospora belbahrii]|uniref:RxLR effector protein n=1 Tax=Peronospora belbahrii TaxID=622444 RepID=A0ABN8CPI5_9STRA|nr:unnamed protein product [Peronospora belbahrii]
MPFVSNAGHVLYAMVLTAATLLACSATNDAAAEPIHKNFPRSFYASNTAHYRTSTSRYLRSNADMAMTDLDEESERGPNLAPTRDVTPTATFQETAIRKIKEWWNLMQDSKRFIVGTKFQDWWQHLSKVKQSRIGREFEKWWWLLSRKSDRYVYNRLKLHETKMELFDSLDLPRYIEFLKLRHKNYYSAMLTSMKEHYTSNEALVGVLVAGLNAKEEESREIATTLLSYQLRLWELDRGGLELGEAFQLMKLSSVKADGFWSSPAVDMWINFNPSSLNPNLLKDKLNILTQHFGDDKIGGVLFAGLGSYSTATIAQLLNLKIKTWKGASMSNTDIFARLEINDKLSEQDFNKWVHFIDVLNPNPTLLGNTISIKLSHTEEEYAHAIVSGTLFGQTDFIAERLMFLMRKKWEDANQNHKSVDDVFKLLELDEVSFHHFNTPSVINFTKYAAARGKTNAEIYDRLKSSYKDDLLAAVLQVAVRSGKDSDSVMPPLLSLHFEHWMKSGVNPENIPEKLEKLKASHQEVYNEVIDAYTKFYSSHKTEIPSN